MQFSHRIAIILLGILVLQAYRHRIRRPHRRGMVSEYPRTPWSLHLWSEQQCKYYTRFTPVQIDEMVKLFGLGTRYRRRIRIEPRDALAMLLYKLAFPSSLYRDQFVFHCSRTRISTVTTDIIMILTEQYSELLQWHPVLNNLEQLRYYARAIAPLGGQGKIWGFIDGTFRPFCRPLDGQRLVYSGHKRAHGGKFQGIATPDGLILSLYGPFEGKINDMNMVHKSGIQGKLETVFQDREALYLYGDPAYSSCYMIMSPYPTPVDTPEQAAFNASLQQSRLTIEWAFGWVVGRFMNNQFKYNLKLGLQPVGSIFQVSVLFANCLTCLQGGNEISSRYGCVPMSLAEYLNTVDERE